MASSSGTSSGSTLLQNSGSEEDLQALMDQRKRKRMISNRESARRSRMRKQKHLDDLIAQAGDLRKLNNEMITRLNITTQHYLNVEAENLVLRTQFTELSNRLQYLLEIVGLLDTSDVCFENGTCNGGFGSGEPPDSPMNPFGMLCLSEPIMDSVDELLGF